MSGESANRRTRGASANRTEPGEEPSAVASESIATTSSSGGRQARRGGGGKKQLRSEQTNPVTETAASAAPQPREKTRRSQRVPTKIVEDSRSDSIIEISEDEDNVQARDNEGEDGNVDGMKNGEMNSEEDIGSDDESASAQFEKVLVADTQFDIDHDDSESFDLDDSDSFKLDETSSSDDMEMVEMTPQNRGNQVDEVPLLKNVSSSKGKIQRKSRTEPADDKQEQVLPASPDVENNIEENLTVSVSQVLDAESVIRTMLTRINEEFTTSLAKYKYENDDWYTVSSIIHKIICGGLSEKILKTMNLEYLGRLFMLSRVFQLIACPADILLDGDSGSSYDEQNLKRLDEAIKILEAGITFGKINVTPCDRETMGSDTFQSSLKYMKLQRFLLAWKLDPDHPSKIAQETFRNGSKVLKESESYFHKLIKRCRNTKQNEIMFDWDSENGVRLKVLDCLIKILAEILEPKQGPLNDVNSDTQSPRKKSAKRSEQQTPSRKRQPRPRTSNSKYNSPESQRRLKIAAEFASQFAHPFDLSSLANNISDDDAEDIPVTVDQLRIVAQFASKYARPVENDGFEFIGTDEMSIIDALSEAADNFRNKVVDPLPGVVYAVEDELGQPHRSIASVAAGSSRNKGKRSSLAMKREHDDDEYVDYDDIDEDRLVELANKRVRHQSTENITESKKYLRDTSAEHLQSDYEGDDEGLEHKRRKPGRPVEDQKKWTPEAVLALENAMYECRSSWVSILEYDQIHGTGLLQQFTQVQLKDKARNERMKRERKGEDLGVFVYATTNLK